MKYTWTLSDTNTIHPSIGCERKGDQLISRLQSRLRRLTQAFRRSNSVSDAEERVVS